MSLSQASTCHRECDECIRLNDEILQLGQQFAANAHRPRAVPTHELPPNLASHDGGRTVVVSGLQQGTRRGFCFAEIRQCFAQVL